MIINEKTKLIDILKEYPNLLDQLKKLNDQFNVLTSPMAKIFLKTVTIKDVSKKIGKSPDELIALIQKFTNNYEQ
jgi:hypothetical protein